MIIVITLVLNQQPIVLVIKSEVLTHRGYDKMATILKNISNAFSWMKIVIFIQIRCKFVLKDAINEHWFG